MAELDVNAYATTGTNTAAGAPTVVETQQPGGSGAVRQVIVNGDAVTRANMQTVKAASTAAVATDMAAVVALHPSSPMTQSDTTVTGTISATDALGGTPSGTGVLISTAPTANSFVAASIPGGTSQIDVQILGTATGTYYFEYSVDSTTGSDGNWVTGLFRQSGINNTVLTLGATTNGLFRGAAAAFKYFRLRNVGGTTPSNAITVRFGSGSGTAFLNAALPGGANTIGSVQLTDGTTVSNNAAGDTGQNAQLIAGNRKEVTITPLTTAGSTPSVDLSNYRWISVHITAIYTGMTSLAFQGSNDNVNWTAVILTPQTTLSGTPFATATTTGIYAGPANFRYFRLTAAGTGSGGSTTVVMEFFSSPAQIQGVMAASQNGTWNMRTLDATGASISSTSGAMNVTNIPVTTGGLSIQRVLSAATTNATSVKATAGQVYGWSIFNTSVATKFVKLYNKASAPTVGTDTPVMTIPIPAGGGSNISLDNGIALGAGIALAITGVVTDADTTATAVNDVICNLLYK